MTFHELAKIILDQENTPLTANEIWQLAKSQKLDKKL